MRTLRVLTITMLALVAMILMITMTNNNSNQLFTVASSPVDQHNDNDNGEDNSAGHVEVESYSAPLTNDKSQTFFLDNFNTDPLSSGRWIPSRDAKYNGKCL